MIEKLKPRERDDGFLEPATPSDIHWKINQLVDAVNGMLYWHENLPRFWQNLSQKENTENETPADPYAEQRKWIGKLCRFWDFVYDHYYFDTLKGITDKGLFIGHNGSWEHCEPVKPDDDIIYKGE